MNSPEMPQLPADLRDKLDQLSEMIGQLRNQLSGTGVEPIDDTVLPPWKKPANQDNVADIITAITTLKDPFNRRSGLKIDGVELTQSSQFYDLHGQGSGEDSDNAVPLVAGKDLILRVYVERRPGSFLPPNSFNGVVTYRGKQVSSLNGPRPLQDATALRRRARDDSLNFRIPAADCHGSITFKVRVYEWRGDSSVVTLGPLHDNYHSATYTIVADFREIPRMKITGVLIRFTGNGMNWAAPTGINLVDSLARFLPMFPIPGFDYNVCQVMDYDRDLTQKANWDDLLSRIQKLRSLATVRTFFVGLLPAGVATLPKAANRGIGNTGCAVGSHNDTRALSHELGHGCMLPHIDQNGAPAPFDDDYPKYKNVSFGSIGEVGFDTARQVLYDPATDFDFMTYNENGSPPPLFPTSTWISPYNYKKMMFFLRASEGTGDLPIIAGIVAVVVALSFRVHRDGRVEIMPSYPLRDTSPRADIRRTNNVRVELYDREGRVIDSHRCHVNNPYQDPEGPYLDLFEMIPWPENVSEVSFLRDGEELTRVRSSENPPQVRTPHVRRVKEGGHEDLARIDWSASADNTIEGRIATAIRYTNDGGRTFHAVATDLSESTMVANLDLLPGGEKCRFQLIVAAGLAATTVDTDSFAVRRKPRRAIIVSPHDGETFFAGEPIVICGAGHSPDWGTSAEDEIMWSSSAGCGGIGTGSRIVRDDLPPGRHRITLVTPDGEGGEASASVWIRILEKSSDRCAPH